MAIAAYLRVSTERQDLDNQRYAVGEHCKAHGLTLGDVVTDTKSGKLSWRDRDLASLIERLAPGDILVTPELSRLSRSLQDVFSFLAETARRQIIVRVIKGNFVIDGSLQSTVLVTAFGLAAEIEREFISQRTKEALARKKREGQTLGRPVGRKNTKTKLSGHEETINNYLKLGLSASAVAKLVKVHPETIRRYARIVPQTSSPAVLPLPSLEPTQKTATIMLRLEVENNSSFVRGRKRARQDIENFHLAQYEMQKLSDDEYELVIPYDDDADLDEQVHELLSDISIEADNRHCFIDADVREKGTERSW